MYILNFGIETFEKNIFIVASISKNGKTIDNIMTDDIDKFDRFLGKYQSFKFGSECDFEGLKPYYQFNS